MANGKHLIIEARGDVALLSQEDLNTLTQRAAVSTGATILFSHFHAFGEGHGSTGVIVLAESHMTVHTWPEVRYAAFDIFVCGDCDPHMAVKLLKSEYPETVFSVLELKRGVNNFNDKKKPIHNPEDLIDET